MQITETLSEGLKRGFTVVVPAAELKTKREKRLAELGKTMQMPGFRPGKVPLSLVTKRYGDAVIAEVAEEAVNAASDQLMTERNLRPAMQPKLEVTNPGPESDLEFTVEMELLPDVALPSLSDITLTRQVAAVSDDAIAEALDKLTKERTDYKAVEEARPAMPGEQLTIDFTGRIDGVAFAGGTAQDVKAVVAGDGFIPGFAEQLEGMSPGETKTITVTFPVPYQAKELAGKTAEFEITAKSLAVPKVPTADDEFAKTIGLDSLAGLRSKISEQINNEYNQLSRVKLKRALLDVLIERAQFAAPESLVTAEFSEIWRQVEQAKDSGNADPEDEAKDETTLRAEYLAIADRRVRLGLLVAEIGRANDVTVTEQELQRAMFNEAISYRDQAMQVVEFFKKNPQQLERFRGPIFEEKVIDYVLGQVTLEDVNVTPEELAADPES